ncbi:hypothetical protein GGU11DRAFT_760475 [Lentinula aff. detonsa]|nr:hypothetical protein GGU11DRAFT_760475 [Lentinula aff. detonsa]
MAMTRGGGRGRGWGPRKRMEDRKKEQLARLRQKLRMRKAIVKKEKGKEQRDEKDDEERRKELSPVVEPPMPLALRSDFPPDHWVEPTEEALHLSPSYPENRVSVMIPPLPPLSPPANGPTARLELACTSCATRRIKCADDETLAARNAHLAKGEKVEKRRRKVVKEVEEDDEEDHDQIKEQQERIENELARITRRLEARENEANEGSEGEEGKEKDEWE